MFMSNFTRCGGLVKFWQSITNLSCCNIDSITKRSSSMKTILFSILFVFTMGSMYGFNAERSVYLDRCLADAPEPQFGQEELEDLYSNECSSDLTFTVTPEIQGDDCDWQIIYTYTISCPDLDEAIIFKTIYRGGDQTAPVLDGTIPSGETNLNLCFEDIPEGPTEGEIEALFSDTCGTVIVEKSGEPSGDDCSWSVTYSYTVRDACDNYYLGDVKVEYSGGDTEAPKLLKGSLIPTGDLNSELCFAEKNQGPTEAEIAALYGDNCGNVNVVKSTYSKGSDCKWMAIYTYVVSDDCGNELAPFEIRYQGRDLINPELFNVPADITVDCIDEVPSIPKKNEGPTATDNCDSDVDITVDNNTDGLGIACEGGVVVRTWTATDDCGNFVTGTQTITVLPAPEAVFDDLDAEVEITCEELGAYVPDGLAYSNGVEAGACAINGVAEPEYTPITENCGSFVVSYSYTDDCDRTITASQTVTVVDNYAPVFDEGALINDLMILTSEGFDCPADAMISLNIGDEFDVSTGWTVAGYGINPLAGYVSDNCAADEELTIRVIDKTASDDVCENRLTITLVAEDNCENISEPITHSYVVKDDTAPTFTAPEDITIYSDNKCEYDVSVDFTGDVTDEADNCNNQMEATYVDSDPVAGQCEGEVIITRTWSLSDSCENAAEDQVQVITVKDNIAPTFKKPADITIYTDEECKYDASTEVTGFPTEIDDNCTTELKPEYTDEVIAGDCNGSYTINRTWTLTDDCLNSAIPQVQVITVEDNTAPVLTIPADETVQCDNIPEVGEATATDNCDDNVRVEFVSENIVDNDGDNCVATYKIFRIWLATDCSGNTHQKTQEITVIDSTDPELQLPADVTVECDMVPALDEGAATATDNCDPNPVVTFIDEKIEQGDDNCDAAYVLFRSWRAEDCSGNSVTGTQTIIVVDTTAPVLTIPADVTVECDKVPDVPVVTATDNCDNNVDISEVEEVRTDGDCPYNYTLTRSWTATDDCGNYVTETQTITVQDTEAPTFKKPGDFEVFTDEECTYNASPDVTGFPTEIEDNCSSLLEPTYTDNIVPGECAGTYDIERTWNLVDECNNAAAPQVQIITVIDNLAPVFNPQCHVEDVMILTSGGYDCPADAMISLNVNDVIDINTGWTVAGAQMGPITGDCVSDNCTPADDLMIRVIDKTASDDVCENRLTITFVAEDDCGNVSDQFTCSYVVKDDTAPTFTAPDDTMIYSDNKCEYDADVAFTGDVMDEADNCNNQLEAMYSDETAPGQCEGEVIITRTWTLADACGNQAESQVQIITVKDNLAPTFKKPADIEIFKDEQCYVDESPANTGEPTEVADNCSTDLKPGYTDETSPICEGSYTITRTWTLTDNCGNSAIPQVQVITVTDNLPPVVTPASDQTVECGPGSTGMCTYYIQLFDSLNDGWQGDTVDVTVNGNIVLDDLALADLFGGDDPVPGENDPMPFEVTTGDTIMTVYVQGIYAGEASWVVLDSAQQVVAEGDGDTPVDITADCGEIVLSSDEMFAAWLANNGGATAFDNCSDVTWTNNSTGLSDLCGNTGSETVTFTATDDCGNSMSTTATFTIQDTTPPSIDTEAEDETVECDGSGNTEALNAWLDANGGATASDLCGTVTWSNDFDALSDLCGATGSATVTFTATDECENTSTSVATFTIEDTVAPEFTFVPADQLNLECGVDPVPTDEALAGDACGMVNVTSGDYYDYTPWRATTDGGDGTVDFGNLPNGFSVTGSDTGTTNIYKTVGLTVVKNVTISFTWSLSSEDFGAFYDEFAYFVNGNRTLVYGGSGEPQDQDFTIDLNAGDVFEVGVTNYANDQDGPATVTIENLQITQNDLECPVVECFIREFKAEDECGNATYAYQQIVFNDTTDPELEVPADITVECDSIPPVCPDATGGSNGGGSTPVPAAWINEFHYDNSGSDTGEFVEVVANFDATGYKVVLYNGSNGTPYNTQVLGAATASNAGVNYYVVNISGIQNGAPDGIALADGADNLVQFLSYEGSFDGDGGPADGVTSTDVGLSETSSTPAGQSLQLTGTGSAYADFTWSGPTAETPGAANAEQTIEVGGGDTGNGDDANISCITYSDLCDPELTAVYNGEVRTDGDCPNNYTLTRSWTVTDDCGNSTTKSQVITVQDTTAPTFTAPGDTEIYTDSKCEFNASPDVTGDVEDEMDNCSDELQATYEDVITDGPCEGSKVITRTWSLVDECENAADDQVQIITVTDNVAPTFTAPADATIDCSESTDPTNPNVGDVVDEDDNCTAVLEATYEDVITEGDCAGNYTITRTWSLVDACGNEADDQVQTITVQDTTAPTLNDGVTLPNYFNGINECAPDADTAIDYGLSEAEIAAYFTDDCSTVVVEKEVKSYIENDCGWALMFGYTISDDCGNEYGSIKISYAGSDQSAPELSDGAELPQSISGLTCKSDAPDAPKASVIAELYEDNCSDVTVELIREYESESNCDWSFEYEYTVTDACGNAASNIIITYSGSDTVAPTLKDGEQIPVGTVNNLDLCLSETDTLGEPTEEEIALLYEDNCEGPIQVTKERTEYVVPGQEDCNWQVWFVYTVADECGNVADTFKLIYHGNDQSAPELLDNCSEPAMELLTSQGAMCPADATIGLQQGDIVDPDALFTVAGIDLGTTGAYMPLCFVDCSDDLTYRVRSVDSGQPDDCERTFSVYIEAVDGCGNVSVDAMLCQFTVKDDTAPVVVECPAGQEYGMVDTTPTDFAESVNYTDNCDTDVQSAYNDTDHVNYVPGNPGSVAESVITFTCSYYYSNYNAFEFVTFTQSGTDNNGRATYDPVNAYGSTYYLYYSNGKWRLSKGNTLVAKSNDDGLYPPCASSGSGSNWSEVHTHCRVIKSQCQGVDMEPTNGVTYYTKVREFRGTDDCGNTSDACEVVYTWSIEDTPQILVRETVDGDEGAKEAKAEKLDFHIYPVPFDKEITVSYLFEYDTSVTIELFDARGLMIAKRVNERYTRGTKGRTYIDLSKYPNQMYYVKLTTNKDSLTKKIVSGK